MIEPLIYGAVVGLSLGLTGGGGSIFAVPLLLYGLGMPLREAVTVSLVVVGLTALFGAVLQSRSGDVLWRAGVILGAGGILGAFPGAKIGDALGETITLLLFAGLMLMIGLRTWRGSHAQEVPLSSFACARDGAGKITFSWRCAGKLIIAGALTGLLSGVFGVGGGFLVVPALLLVTGQAMHSVLATSLVAITLISASAFLANITRIETFPFMTAVLFLVGGMAGMGGGTALKKHIRDLWLKRTFAAGAILVAVAMLAKLLR